MPGQQRTLGQSSRSFYGAFAPGSSEPVFVVEAPSQPEALQRIVLVEVRFERVKIAPWEVKRVSGEVLNFPVYFAGYFAMLQR